MTVPLGAMTGAEVGMVEKKQGRLTFPERDPVIGLIIDNALEAERQKGKKGYILQHMPIHSILYFWFNFLLYDFFL